MATKTKLVKDVPSSRNRFILVGVLVAVVVLASLFFLFPKEGTIAGRAIGYEQNEIICVSNLKQINNQLDQLRYFIEQSKTSTTASITSGYAAVLSNIASLANKGADNYKGDGNFPTTLGKFPSNVLDADTADVDDFEEEINDVSCDFS